MKFKHKELFVGIVLGAMIFGGISIFADGTLNVYPNPFKITVNGVEKDIEGYNINEYSYFKLRDIGEQVGFDVDFEEDTIMINTSTNAVTENTPATSGTNDGFNYVTIDGEEYISCKDVDSFLIVNYFDLSDREPSWGLVFSSRNSSWTDGNGYWCYLSKIITEENGRQYEEASYKIPCVFIDNDDIPYLTREVFETEVLARIYE